MKCTMSHEAMFIWSHKHFIEAIWKSNKQHFVSVLVNGLANPFRKVIMLELLAVFCEYLYTKVSLSNWYQPFSTWQVSVSDQLLKSGISASLQLPIDPHSNTFVGLRNNASNILYYSILNFLKITLLCLLFFFLCSFLSLFLNFVPLIIKITSYYSMTIFGYACSAPIIIIAASIMNNTLQCKEHLHNKLGTYNDIAQ